MANDQKIWDVIFKETQNPYGTAAIMGNLRAESGMNPCCITGKNAKGKTGGEYVAQVNDGTITGEDFAHDGIAFGLAQWLYWSRKKALYIFAREHEGIGDPETQAAFLINELKSYKTVWNAVCTATDIQAPCDIFMERYEKPATMTEAAKQRRRDFAAIYFQKFYNESEPKEPEKTTDKEPEDIQQEPVKKKPKAYNVRTTAPKVRIRVGNGMQYDILGMIYDEGAQYPWVATSENNWHAIVIHNRVAWISGEFSEIVEV